MRKLCHPLLALTLVCTELIVVSCEGAWDVKKVENGIHEAKEEGRVTHVENTVFGAKEGGTVALTAPKMLTNREQRIEGVKTLGGFGSLVAPAKGIRPFRALFKNVDKKPFDAKLWAEAQTAAEKGGLNFLSKILESVRGGGDVLLGDKRGGYQSALADVHLKERKDGSGRQTKEEAERYPWAELAEWESKGASAHIAEYRNGTRNTIPTVAPQWSFPFDTDWSGADETQLERRPAWDQVQPKGGYNDVNFKTIWQGYPDNLVGVKTKFKILSFVGDNWGYLSTYFPNRTESWGVQEYCYDEMARKKVMAFLDDPRLEFIITQQHFNLSHPKIISKPLGVLPGERWGVFETMKEINKLLERDAEGGVPIKDGRLGEENDEAEQTVEKKKDDEEEEKDCLDKDHNPTNCPESTTPKRWRGRLLYASMNPNRNRPWLFKQIQQQFPAPLGNQYFAGAGENQDGAPGSRSSREHQKVQEDRDRPKNVYFEELARSRFVLGLPGTS
jgi:hypothetical protein